MELVKHLTHCFYCSHSFLCLFFSWYNWSKQNDRCYHGIMNLEETRKAFRSSTLPKLWNYIPVFCRSQLNLPHYSKGSHDISIVHETIVEGLPFYYSHSCRWQRRKLYYCPHLRTGVRIDMRLLLVSCEICVLVGSLWFQCIVHYTG